MDVSYLIPRYIGYMKWKHLFEGNPFIWKNFWSYKDWSLYSRVSHFSLEIFIFVWYMYVNNSTASCGLKNLGGPPSVLGLRPRLTAMRSKIPTRYCPKVGHSDYCINNRWIFGKCEDLKVTEISFNCIVNTQIIYS